MKVITVDTPLLGRALQLYRDRSDRSWGLTDCISFTVMNHNQVTEALTADRDFVQSGFVALLRPSGP
jgi:predicted nucleic acid-binding protein